LSKKLKPISIFWISLLALIYMRRFGKLLRKLEMGKDSR